MYKKRLKEYNCRKNVRSTESDVQAYQRILSSKRVPARIPLSNGQIVTSDLLAAHMQRKMYRIQAPAVTRAPDRYYFVESACTYTHFYLVSCLFTSSYQFFCY